MVSLVSTSRRNALPDYLRHALLPWESEAEFHDHLNDYLDQFSPVGPVQLDCVETLALIAWKRRRIMLAERAAHMAMAKKRASIERADPVARRALCADPDAGMTLTNSYEALRKDDDADVLQRVESERELRGIRTVLQGLKDKTITTLEEALQGLPRNTLDWWEHIQENEDENEFGSDLKALVAFLVKDVIKMLEDDIEACRQRPIVRQQIHGESVDPDRLEALHKLDERLARQYEQTLKTLDQVQRGGKPKHGVKR